MVAIVCPRRPILLQTPPSSGPRIAPTTSDAANHALMKTNNRQGARSVPAAVKKKRRTLRKAGPSLRSG
jgi:hypothetical protein